MNTCGECGDWLCDECTAEVGGRHFCIPCLQKKWSHEHDHIDPHAHFHQEHDFPPVPPHPVYPSYYPPRKHVNWGLLFIFSFLPGLNYMYEGLIKRGLFVMLSFFASIYATSILAEPFIGVIIAVIWFASFFDGYRIRRYIETGVDVPDSVDDITGFIKEHKNLFIIVAFVMIGFAGLNYISGLFGNYYLYQYVWRPVRTILPLGALLFGLYLIVTSGKKKSDSSTIDHRVPPGNGPDNV
jgi:hypothetical protein